MTQTKSNGKAGSLVKRIEYLERQDKIHKDNVWILVMFGYGFFCIGVGFIFGWMTWGI